MNGVVVNVVVVVINAPYPSLSLKSKSKESKLEPPIVENGDCVKAHYAQSYVR
jgi:hypothetical protein